MPLAETLTFWDVFWLVMSASLWLALATFVVIVLIDNFRRSDQSGWAKAAWTVLVLALPLLGVIVYQIARPTSLFAEKEWDANRVDATRQEMRTGRTPTA